MLALSNCVIQSELLQDLPGGGIQAVAADLVTGKVVTIHQGDREACLRGFGGAAATSRTGADDGEVVISQGFEIWSPASVALDIRQLQFPMATEGEQCQSR